MGVICNTKTEDEKNIIFFIDKLEKFCVVGENNIDIIQKKKRYIVDSKTADFISKHR
jgi:hypothetical protein